MAEFCDFMVGLTSYADVGELCFSDWLGILNIESH